MIVGCSGSRWCCWLIDGERMQITRNSTGMCAELAVLVDKDAHDYCVVVIKGTFEADCDGNLSLAAEQQPFVYADEHFGDPQTTGIRLECDFAVYKPLTDVVVLGRAISPDHLAVRELPVRLEVDGRHKDVIVHGNSEPTWLRAPQPFTEMPLEPFGFGFVGRSSPQRAGFAGTYDRRWLDEVCPFLPEDFDHRYFQGAPPDQQYPHFRGGEVIRGVHMAERPVVQYNVPGVELPVRYRFRRDDVVVRPVLDTVVLEPDRDRATFAWRTRVRLGKKNDELLEIHVGNEPTRDTGFYEYRRGKPAFRGIAETLRWLRARRVKS